jgi:uncharacterized membrane protein
MGVIKEIRIYRCDHCKKVGRWGEGWLSKMICHKTWDEILTVCSQKCADALDNA